MQSIENCWIFIRRITWL